LGDGYADGGLKPVIGKDRIDIGFCASAFIDAAGEGELALRSRSSWGMMSGRREIIKGQMLLVE
jgi:hypothetical protein